MKMDRAGHLEYLPAWHAKTVDLPFFQSAFRATAFANFARRCNSSWALQSAFKEYGKAVLLVNEALRDPSLVTKDETIQACQLLGICEV